MSSHMHVCFVETMAAMHTSPHVTLQHTTVYCAFAAVTLCRVVLLAFRTIHTTRYHTSAPFSHTTDNLAEKRRYELEWGRLQVLTKIAGKGRKFITGDRADQLMDDLCPVHKEVMSRN